jgi:serine/threonine protein kinase
VASEETGPAAAADSTVILANTPGSPASSPGLNLPGLVGGKYRPVRQIAKGGMGVVYEVEHVNTGERLALKLMLARTLLAPELVERFRREARIPTSVKSEHVVRVVDADVARELDDAPFLVMELLQGQDFERICIERRPSIEEVVDWMRQLATALDKTHQEGIVHRDLKPENLFLAERPGHKPLVKILDFGIAKMTSEVDGRATATGQILGTPRYMAPEQAVGAKYISAAADRFALGLIAFRMVCGRHYFMGDNWVSLLREVSSGPKERPSARGSDRGGAFDAWFARACAFEPGDRFPSCLAQVEALAQALASPPKRRPSRQARGWVVAVASVCALAATVWAVVGHRKAGGVQSSGTVRPPAIPAVAAPPPELAPAAHPAAAPAERPAQAPELAAEPAKPRPRARPAAAARPRTPAVAAPAPDPYADQK